MNYKKRRINLTSPIFFVKMYLKKYRFNIIVIWKKNSVLNANAINPSYVFKVMKLVNISKLVSIAEIPGRDIMGKYKQKEASKYLNEYYHTLFVAKERIEEGKG